MLQFMLPCMLLAALAGCGGKPATVSGVVTLDGKPLERGSVGFTPVAGGMRAALPFVDRFLPGHNLRSLEELGAVLAGIERRHAA